MTKVLVQRSKSKTVSQVWVGPNGAVSMPLRLDSRSSLNHPLGRCPSNPAAHLGLESRARSAVLGVPQGFPFLLHFMLSEYRSVKS